MEVIAADPQKATDFANALVGYAEEQVDHLTQRMRGDQMEGALERYKEAETNPATGAAPRGRAAKEKFKILSSDVEVSLITGQITNLETQLITEKLSGTDDQQPTAKHALRMGRPINVSACLRRRSLLRARLTEQTGDGESIAVVQSELLTARTDVETRQMLLAQALQAMEASRTEANRPGRYLQRRSAKFRN